MRPDNDPGSPLDPKINTLEPKPETESGENGSADEPLDVSTSEVPSAPGPSAKDRGN